MKDEDVIIGMKVRIKGTEDACIILNEKDYRTAFGNVYSVKNIKTGKKITVNACDFESYIDIQEAVDALNRAFNNLNKAFETLQELAEKNRDAIEEFAKKTEKERLEEEIQKSFKLHVKKHGTDFSLFSCYKAGYIAGREGK